MNAGGAVARDGRLRPGLRIIEVNDVSLLGATYQESVKLLKNTGNKTTLLVCDGYDPNLVISSPSSTAETPTPTSPGRSVKSFIDREDDEVFSQNSEYINEREDIKPTKNQINLSKSHSPNINNVVSKSEENSLIEFKDVEQKVIDVVKAADQLVKPMINSTNSKEQKTTTVIMKKQGITPTPKPEYMSPTKVSW